MVLMLDELVHVYLHESGQRKGDYIPTLVEGRTMSFPMEQALQINLFIEGILLLGILCPIELVKIRHIMFFPR